MLNDSSHGVENKIYKNKNKKNVSRENERKNIHNGSGK